MCELWGLPGPDARVDPAAFPEADFPVYCMRCGYELRGLAESRCPECGDPFDRGHLLLEQYIHCKRPRTDRRYRLAQRLGRAAMALILGALLVNVCGRAILKTWGDALLERLTISPYVYLLMAPFLLKLLGSLCLGLHLLLWRFHLPSRTKRRAVLQAWQTERRRARARKEAGESPPA